MGRKVYRIHKNYYLLIGMVFDMGGTPFEDTVTFEKDNDITELQYYKFTSYLIIKKDGKTVFDRRFEGFNKNYREFKNHNALGLIFQLIRSNRHSKNDLSYLHEFLNTFAKKQRIKHNPKNWQSPLF